LAQVQVVMRFLLLSFLDQVSGQAYAGVACGTKTGSDGLGFVASGACVTNSYCCTTNADCANDNTKQLKWWAADGTDTAHAASGGSCTYDADPWVGTEGKDSDNLWDPMAKSNYEVKNNYVAVATGDAVAITEPTDLTTGFAALAQGEAISTDLIAALRSIQGSGNADSDTVILCTKATRAKFRTLDTATNIVKPAVTGTVGRCVDQVLVATMIDANMLDHNAAGDGTKECYHLPWDANYKAAAACTATQACDRFVESADLCVLKTKQMSAYTAATATVDHCTIQPGAGKNDKYRHMGANFSSQTCAVGEFCNMYGTAHNADPICIASTKSIAASAKAAARVAGVAVSSTDTSLKWCIGVTLGAKQCAVTQVCNPHAATRAELCIHGSTATATDHPKSMAFGAVGAAAPTAGTDNRKYCIGDNAAGAICGAATVCNYAGGTQSDSTVGGDVCLPHTKLLGTIADTAPWTAAAQKKLDGVATKFCLATDGTTFSSKECATTEKCNPHASSPADVCKKGTTVLNHGDIAPEAADPVADSVVVCIGKSFWKNCASTNGDVKEVCNEGAAALTDVCILTTDCANAEEPMKAFREAGVETAEDQKWCFATDGAAKCGLDTLCNPSGVDGGTGSAAICADATKRVPHGEAATEELIHCYGNTGNAALATDESEDGWLCDEGKGKFHDPKTKMEPRSKNETPDPVPEGEKAVEVCFGKDKVETCDVGVYCNSMGTETGCSAAACTSKNICITEESIIAEGEQWVEEGKSVCLNADATAGEDCTTDKMYCDQTEGVCSAEEIASTEEPSSGEGEGTASGCATQSLAAAAVVAILSA